MTQGLTLHNVLGMPLEREARRPGSGLVLTSIASEVADGLGLEGTCTEELSMGHAWERRDTPVLLPQAFMTKQASRARLAFLSIGFYFRYLAPLLTFWKLPVRCTRKNR